MPLGNDKMLRILERIVVDMKINAFFKNSNSVISKQSIGFEKKLICNSIDNGPSKRPIKLLFGTWK